MIVGAFYVLLFFAFWFFAPLLIGIFINVVDALLGKKGDDDAEQ